MENGAVKESMVVCQTTQGVAIRASLLRLTRFAAFFEIYNPACVLRLSEVLSECQIIIQDRTLYSGRAVIRNLVNAGMTVVCEASLEDASWTDVEFTPANAADGSLGQEFMAFFREWQKLYRVSQDYKVVIADLQTFLTDARLWLEQVELGIRSTPSGDRNRLEQDVVHQLERSVVPAINSLFERFEVVAQGIEEDLQPVHRTFGKRQLHPLLLSSPFVYRTFHKPLGYAGDYEVVNMMFREPYEGGSLFAKVVNTYALQLPPIVAHRHRIAFLLERLSEETRRLAAQDGIARIFNLGCGPAQEVQLFLAADALCDRASFTLADFNDETVAHTGAVVGELKNRYARNTQIQMIKRSVQQLLKQADRAIQRPASEQYDVVCCAGLFDYLSDKVCRKLMDLFYDMLAPGGLLLTTNVDVHRCRGEMEHFLEWHLVHRNTAQMAALAPSGVIADQVSLTRDPTGVNIFMSVRKPKGER
jgi:extracellular factor (EF) 3-hydroxypalmitic acid methyl ester biosynthesis protein